MRYEPKRGVIGREWGTLLGEHRSLARERTIPGSSRWPGAVVSTAIISHSMSTMTREDAMESLERRDEILRLLKEGEQVSKIAKLMGVSRQWIYHVIANPEPIEEKKRATPEEDLEVARKIIASRNNWTWNEADDEFEKEGLNISLHKAYGLLRQSGFVWVRKKRRWYLDGNVPE